MQHEGVGIRTKLGDDERYALRLPLPTTCALVS